MKMRGNSERTKCSHACTFCRVKKAKCNGRRPCGTCIDRGEDCVYPTIVPRRKRKSKEEALDERFARLEAAITATLTQRSIPDSNAAGQLECTQNASPSSNFHVAETLGQPMSPEVREAVSSVNDVIDSPRNVTQHLEPSPLFPDSSQIDHPAMNGPTPIGHEAALDLEPNPPTKRPRLWSNGDMSNPRGHIEQQPTYIPPSPPSTAGVGSTISYNNCNSELESNTYLPICSEDGIDWVTREMGITDFISSARRLTTDVLRNEQLQQKVRLERAPEPTKETAFEWTTTFFDEGLDSIYGVVHRPSFEARLREHFASESTAVEDPAWYALRNAVYASGCRLVHSEETSPSSFNEARAKAWRYYENALSVHTELIYARSDITAVQALLLMAFFAEALGSPAIEFMVLSNATRLAQSKGMHLQECSGLRIKDEDTLIRQWLWWCLYSYDKHLAYRSGRPSVIDDDYIGCPIPSRVPTGSMINLEFFRSTIQHAQISSKIAKQLGTIKAMQRSPEETLETVQRLEQELNNWHQSLPKGLQSKPPFRLNKLPPGVQLFHIVYLHFSYHGSLIAIHAAFCYPWNRPGCAKSQNPRVAAQRTQSTDILAESSRQIIMATQRLQISAATPVWLTFYFPLIGLINLFIYVLKYPHAPTVQSDISLMDVIVGHFGYLEYVSASELRFPFPREIVGYARSVVKRAKESPRSTHDTYNSQSFSLDRDLFPSDTYAMSELWNGETDDFQLEDWPSFLPSFSGVTTMMRNGPPQPQDIDLILGQL